MTTPDISIVRTVAGLRDTTDQWRARGLASALVPTMGALHDGHLSLVDLARAHAGRVIVSIFVNPTQFGPAEDLDTYPRDEAGDAAKLSKRGVDVIFAPDNAAMYPTGFATEVIVSSLTDCLCGAARPGHFTGVATIVAKLLNQARTDIAIFGEKDYQQLLVVKRLARDLDIGTEILAAPIVREPDGMALSSRNFYLTSAQRRRARQFNVALKNVAREVAAGDDIGASLARARNLLAAAGIAKIDYLEVRSAVDLSARTGSLGADDPVRVFGAVYVGKTRLIDNEPVG